MNQSLRRLEEALTRVDVLRTQEKRRETTLSGDMERNTKRVAEIKEAIRLCDLCLGEQLNVTVHIEEMVDAFMGVFKDNISFQFVPTTKADGVTIVGTQPTFLTDGKARPPSGGQRMVAALALRLAFLKIFEGQVEPVLLLDEYLAEVDPALIPQICEIMRQIGVQTFLVTHLDVEFPMTYKVVKSGGISRVEVWSK